MLVVLTHSEGAVATSPGFTASYAGTPALPIGLQPESWHHISCTVSATGLAALFVNGTQQHPALQLLWDPLPTQNPLSFGEHATAIGRGSPAWQDGGDVGYGCMAVDELRFWTSERSETNILSNMYVGCLDLVNTTAQLAACYDFDQIKSAAGFVDKFEDASSNHISAFAAAHGSPHLPWCVNVDDNGGLELDTLTTATQGNPLKSLLWCYKRIHSLLTPLLQKSMHQISNLNHICDRNVGLLCQQTPFARCWL